MPQSALSIPSNSSRLQVGFAGKRQLFPGTQHEPELTARLHEAVAQYLERRLKALPAELGLALNSPLCGISQVAIGADLLFARACQSLGIPQRIFLPESRQAYLSAVDPTGIADFTSPERAEAESLLASGQILEERVVSKSRDRNTRFAETNVEILRASDVVVCLLTDEPGDELGDELANGAQVVPAPAALPGGTKHLLELASQCGTPALEIRVGLYEGSPRFRERWHPEDPVKRIKPR